MSCSPLLRSVGCVIIAMLWKRPWNLQFGKHWPRAEQNRLVDPGRPGSGAPCQAGRLGDVFSSRSSKCLQISPVLKTGAEVNMA